jgi:hypothetical protein
VEARLSRLANFLGEDRQPRRIGMPRLVAPLEVLIATLHANRMQSRINGMLVTLHGFPSGSTGNTGTNGGRGHGEPNQGGATHSKRTGLIGGILMLSPSTDCSMQYPAATPK